MTKNNSPPPSWSELNMRWSVALVDLMPAYTSNIMKQTLRGRAVLDSSYSFSNLMNLKTDALSTMCGCTASPCLALRGPSLLRVKTGFVLSTLIGRP